jgi:hypothetical protein
LHYPDSGSRQNATQRSKITSAVERPRETIYELAEMPHLGPNA